MNVKPLIYKLAPGKLYPVYITDYERYNDGSDLYQLFRETPRLEYHTWGRGRLTAEWADYTRMGENLWLIDWMGTHKYCYFTVCDTFERARECFVRELADGNLRKS